LPAFSIRCGGHPPDRRFPRAAAEFGGVSGMDLAIVAPRHFMPNKPLMRFAPA
jgi:hypothetical protein